jgi:hypothetical protein
VPNSAFAFALFLSSYSPAFLILAVRSVHHSSTLFWISLSIALMSAGAFFLFMKVARTGGPFRARVEEVEPRDGDLAAYVAAYLLPFVVVFGATVQDVIALALFLLFIGVLWVNSRMIYLNPLLALAGYHVYVVRLRSVGADAADTLSRSFLLSHQRNLGTGDEVRPDRIAPGVFIDLTTRADSSDNS